MLVDAVCDAGVDINLAVEYRHFSSKLAFVSGLGLRKSDMLVQNCQRMMSVVSTRQELLEKKLLGKCCYLNAAGFLRISDSSYDDSHRVEILDNTRIHPESYVKKTLVQKICSDAMLPANADDLAITEHNMKDPAMNIRACIKNSRKAIKERLKMIDGDDWCNVFSTGKRPTELPSVAVGEHEFDGREPMDELRLIDLDHYNGLLVREGQPSQLYEMNLIKEELRYPWLDLRPPLSAPTGADMFALQFGESDESLHPGMIISATVTNIGSDVWGDLRLEGGLRGSISRDEVSDNGCESIQDFLKVGDEIRAVVIKVDKMRFKVNVSMKESLLREPEWWWVQNRKIQQNMIDWCNETNPPRMDFDPCFDEQVAIQELIKLQADEDDKARAAASAEKAASSAPSTSRQSFIARPVYHPAFQNVDYAQAQRQLLEAGQGECIIRPSLSANKLTISWCMVDKLVKHIEVEERNKAAGEVVGSQLYIRGIDEPFSDLDEILANYISPMNDHVSAMLESKYFITGDVVDVEAELKRQKKPNPKKTTFGVLLDPQHPGYFALTWLPGLDMNKPFSKEYISVVPGGFKFRDIVYSTWRGPLQRFTEWLQSKMQSARQGGSGSASGSVSASNGDAPRRSRFSDSAGAMPAQPPAPEQPRANSRFSAY